MNIVMTYVEVIKNFGYICPICLKKSTVEEWIKSTQKYYENPIVNIKECLEYIEQENGEDYGSFTHLCPKCRKHPDTSEIKKVNMR